MVRANHVIFKPCASVKCVNGIDALLRVQYSHNHSKPLFVMISQS